MGFFSSLVLLITFELIRFFYMVNFIDLSINHFIVDCGIHSIDLSINIFIVDYNVFTIPKLSINISIVDCDVFFHKLINQHFHS